MSRMCDKIHEDMQECDELGKKWGVDAKYVKEMRYSKDWDGYYRTMEGMGEKTSHEKQNIPHYTNGFIECIDAIKSALTEEEFRGFCKGNIIKYTWREKHKGGDKDLVKAKDYINFLLDEQK